ncbi:MAG: hypothetical protein GX262_12320 [Clostridia bacterium]|nr:hypothetical protein [Clostridia bacterium]
MNKKDKLYNVIFPVWFLWLVPPVIFVAALGNFVVDSVVLLLAYRLFIVGQNSVGLWGLYRQSIIKVWLFGFLADFIGTIPLIGLVATGLFPLPYEVETAIMWNPWTNSAALLIVFGCVVLAGALVFFFNNRFALKEVIPHQKERFKTAVLLAVLTAPYTLLLPTEWFYC